ncbi:hypothetical protein L1987_80547 [Smallanthus sonchifolius]|uniref:Uncharacterized protein n=1 Tax=Smallanthus sonchifolius TaxID=185202 RepID=A0ACB8YNI6_9ASTR|nr:hypothetical protein L1987_80547 [Smallanthus sonchifolius]
MSFDSSSNEDNDNDDMNDDDPVDNVNVSSPPHVHVRTPSPAIHEYRHHSPPLDEDERQGENQEDDVHFSSTTRKHNKMKQAEPKTNPEVNVSNSNVNEDELSDDFVVVTPKDKERLEDELTRRNLIEMQNQVYFEDMTKHERVANDMTEVATSWLASIMAKELKENFQKEEEEKEIRYEAHDNIKNVYIRKAKTPEKATLEKENVDDFYSFYNSKIIESDKEESEKFKFNKRSVEQAGNDRFENYIKENKLKVTDIDQQDEKPKEGDSSTPVEKRMISKEERAIWFKKPSSEPLKENIRTRTSFDLELENFTREILKEKITSWRMYYDSKDGELVTEKGGQESIRLFVRDDLKWLSVEDSSDLEGMEIHYHPQYQEEVDFA